MKLGHLFSVCALSCIQVARGLPQVSLFPIGFEDASLSGFATGTGADGTTYVLEGTSFDGVALTVTLVEASNHISEFAAIPSVALTVDNECSMSGSAASCHEVIAGLTATTTIDVTGHFDYTPVPTFKPTSIATARSSGGAGQSTLPAQLSTSAALSSPSSTLSSSTNAGTTTTGVGSTNGASRAYDGTGLSMVLAAMIVTWTMV